MVALPSGIQSRRWAGPLPTDGRRMGRRPRSSPSVREALAAKGASKSAVEELEYQEVSPVNTDELEYALFEAEHLVLQIQTKLHRWAGKNHCRFDDLFNLVVDPAFLLIVLDRVRGNKGARTAGIETTSSIAQTTGVEKFLDELRDSVKDRSFRPLPSG